MKDLSFVFDVGGTNTRAAVTDGERLLKKATWPTPVDYETGVQRLTEQLELWRAAKGPGDQASPSRWVGAVAGTVHLDGRSLVRAPHLSDWVGQPLWSDLNRRFKLRSGKLINDAAAAALGEANKGSGRGFNIVAYLTIGTGVGGARVEHGHLTASAAGFEPGHQLIGQAVSDKRDNGRQLVTVEDLISGTALAKRASRPLTEVKEVKFWRTVTLDTALAIHNLILTWSPDVVVLGGSVTKQLQWPLLRQTVRQQLGSWPKQPVIKQSKLKDLAGLWGASLVLYLEQIKVKTDEQGA
ncbi:MAG: ROK family protein [bacterium]|nr:ROK family protein [bacterium]